MLQEQDVIEALKSIQDPDLNKSIVDTGGIRDIRIKNEDNVSLKIALARTGTGEQMKVQQDIVAVVKEAGASQVGLRFEELSKEEVEEHGDLQQEQGGEEGGGILNDNTVNFIAVASGKGGVGKSTVTVNLAVALAREGKKVGIIDADIYGFSVPDMMGIENRPTVEGEKIHPVERYGVKVISMGFFVEDNAPVVWRGPMLGKMLTNFFNEVTWGDLDYLLLDLPPGTGDTAMDVHSMLPESEEIIVTTPHATAAFVAARAGAMAIKSNHRILGVVENMAYYESKTGEKEYVFGQGGGERLTEELKVEMLGQVPLGQPTIDDDDFAPSVYEREHPIGKMYENIAARVIEKKEPKEERVKSPFE
ncbi:Mrp/NBP35 family ATP-binding protein [Natribacillus halophilus]|uniref:Iron-sulfur cluster carrier protein n=1 Tax=Natribacillus halophilus TaxID=549003 RepID=A0A1G8QUW6_9BACI|nr:Mrp/NBP35 family ATP-binding protein [Natribacillus halophilus]SDJ08105.1 ATP-binding protein involved in chromosome partitioning [Natribacillus halophilus]